MAAVTNGKGITEDQAAQDDQMAANNTAMPAYEAPEEKHWWNSIGSGIKAAGAWAMDHRGLIATIVASGACFVPAVGWAACAGLQALAFAVRTQQTIAENGGWEKNKTKILTDAVLTGGAIGLGAAFRVAQFGTLAAVPDAPIVALPRFISPASSFAQKAVQTDAWNTLGLSATGMKVVGWTVPSMVTSKLNKLT